MELLSVLIALVINAVNLFISLRIIKRIINQKWSSFIKKFFIMMIVRLFVVIILFFILLKVFKLSEFYLSFTFIITYFVLLMYEILYLNKRYRNLFLNHTKKIKRETNDNR